ncbi:type II secretion system F family protein [Allopontixanthobacter sp.]|uniref:type II secretion system F family protein n=1 Tax=Allopontixanthobacter sp. TaxID=2906452 RepID=UPI002ABC72B3|nr:type II secretion system F family protein [Allopontixanthobacter sp.]MDZ4306993.1 type II secretion system F family protein [Allopontixanthobacter sp.]
MFGGEIVRVIVLLAVFASVFLLLQVFLRLTADRRSLKNAVNKRMGMIATGVDREDIVAVLRKNQPDFNVAPDSIFGKAYSKFRQNLLMSAVPFTADQVIIAMGILFAAICLIIGSVIWAANIPLTFGVAQMVLVFAAALAIGLPILAISFVAQRRRKKMQAQFPVSLDIFVRALRSGHPVSSAIELLTQEMEDPIGSEYGLVSDEVSYGAELTDALNEMAERWGLEDIRMFVVSLSIQNETGGNLAEVLSNLSQVIRERASLFLKVRALSSEGRMTGWVLVATPVVTFVMLFLANPEFYLGVATDPIFYIGFSVMIVWYFVGLYWIRKLVDLKV